MRRGTTRRGLLLGGAAAGLAGGGRARAEAPLADGGTLIAAGPAGGSIARWAEALAGKLGQSLPTLPTLHVQAVGGLDGVTAANQFDARTDPDGSTVLLMPGTAPLAALVGDPRANFAVGHWVPLLTALTPALICLRAPTGGPPRQGLRLAMGEPGGADVAALLALDLLGLRPLPVKPGGLGLGDGDVAREAFARGMVDAVPVGGRHAVARCRDLQDLGARPYVALGVVDELGHPVRDAGWPDVPHVLETLDGQGRPAVPRIRRAAYQAVALACQLDMGMVLPNLTPAAQVANWRMAASAAAASLELQAMATDNGIRLAGGAVAAANFAAMVAAPPLVAELHDWLGKRLRWQPE